jgi:hypothetical protein
MPRLAKTVAVLGAVGLLAGVPAASVGSGPTATAATKCSLSSKPRAYGPTYVTSLRVSGTSCRNGRKLVRGYYNCRIHNGGRKGRCSGVYGYHCHESRTSSAVQFDALAKCSKSGRRIDHRYTQNT